MEGMGALRRGRQFACGDSAAQRLSTASARAARSGGSLVGRASVCHRFASPPARSNPAASPCSITGIHGRDAPGWASAGFQWALPPEGGRRGRPKTLPRPGWDNRRFFRFAFRHDDAQPPRSCQRHPFPCHRRRAGGQLRPPGHADGHGRHRRSAVERLPQGESGQSRLGRPRPLRAVQRPRLDAAVRAVAPGRVRPADRRAQALPPARQPHPGPPGEPRHPGRGDHHRPVGPGAGECGRLRAGGEAAGAALQPRRTYHRRPPHLGVPGRRLPDGGHLA